jgi:hypothetical protein
MGNKRTVYHADMVYKFLRYEYRLRDGITSLSSSMDIRREFHPHQSIQQHTYRFFFFHNYTDDNNKNILKSIHMGNRNSIIQNMKSIVAIRKKSNEPLLIQLSHASMFVVCIVSLHIAGKCETNPNK